MPEHHHVDAVSTRRPGESFLTQSAPDMSHEYPCFTQSQFRPHRQVIGPSPFVAVPADDSQGRDPAQFRKEGRRANIAGMDDVIHPDEQLSDLGI